jgi:hypothetical protein
MIKAVLTRQDGTGAVIVLGLSGENITRLAAGEPILIDGGDIGIPGKQIAIIYGKTEDVIAESLQHHGFNPYPPDTHP